MFFVLMLVLVPSPAGLLARLLFVEVHYNPAGAPGSVEKSEFVEIYNDEPLPFDMTGFRLGGGIDFTFAPGDRSVVGARSVLVVALDPDFLAAAYGIALPAGPFSGRLDNDGDDVLLLDTAGTVVARVDYDDRDRWPSAADGAGHSLVLRGPLFDTRESASWGWSPVRGGTPGEVSFETVTPEVVINEVKRDGTGSGWIELFNLGGEALDLSGHRLVQGAAGTSILEIPAATMIPARGFVKIDEAELAAPLDLLDQPLLLIAPEGERVIDAHRLGDVVDGMTDGRFPDGGPRWFRLCPATPAAANRLPPAPPVVISELHYHPMSEAEAEEFLEITNTGTASIDLEGFRFTAGISYTFPPGAAIVPGEYLVVARNPQRLEDVHGLAGVYGPYEGVLSNGGEMVRLRDASGNPVDEVRYYDEGSWTRWADGDGPSLELVDLAQDNSVGSTWRQSDLAVRSEWRQYEYTGRQGGGDSEFHLHLLGAGAVLVDDIEVIPAGGGSNYIPGGDFDGADPLSGWRLEGTHIESGLEVGGGVGGTNALRVEATGRGDSRVNRIERQTSPSLLSGAEYTVRFRARWLRGSSLIMTRSWNHGIARVTQLEVPLPGGTPGRANSRASVNTAPVIWGVEQTPVLPAAAAAVTITCRVSDPDGVSEVMLQFRREGDPEFSSTAMTVGDGGLYTGTIAGSGSENGTVEFHIVASDGGGRERVEPPDAPGENFLFQYDDGVTIDEVPAYRLVMTLRDHLELRGRSPFSNSLLPCTFIHGTERIFHGAGLRYRGSPFLRRDSITGFQKGIRVRLNDEDPLYRTVRMSLDEQAVDPTFQVDRLVLHFLRRAGGIPHTERKHIKLILRGMASTRAFEHVVHIDGRFIERAFADPDGELYKIDAHYEINDVGEFAFPSFTSFKYTDNKEDLRFTYKKRSHEEADDFSQLFELLDVMDTGRTSDEEFDVLAPDIIDLDMWIKAIAVYRAVEDWDAIGGWTGKNVYLYRPPGDRWKVIAWDHDVALGSAALRGDQNVWAYIYTPYFPELLRLLERPVLDRKFNAELLRLMEEDYNNEAVDPILDETYSVLRATTGARSPGRLKTFITLRRQNILSSIEDPPAFIIETGGGETISTDEPVLGLRGQAPFRIESILLAVNGAPVIEPVRWVSKTSWEMDLPLEVTRNEVTLLAFDGDGGLVSAVSITVIRHGLAGFFVRGDANGDGRANITDAVRILLHLFLAGELACLDAADVDDSGVLDTTDPIYLLDFLFRSGPMPPPPFLTPDVDPTADRLEC